MNFLWIGLFSALVAPLSAAAQTVAERLAVVELFTSQGCSSCPPADAFLGELAGRPDVLALSEHVDYWDYLGWRDPFASREHTRRQRDYAQRLGLSYVYTPQMVVQGALQGSGADRNTVHRLIAEARTLPAVAVGFDRDDTGGLVVRFDSAALPEPMDVWLVRFDLRRATTVAKGENGGRQVVNHNVVRDLTRLASWDGTPLTLPIADAPGAPDDSGTAVLVQHPKTGRIIGAARTQSPSH